MPRPNWLLLASSILLIGACLFIGGFMVAGFAHWDPCAWFASAILVGPSFLFAAWQYAATFRASRSAAKKLLIALGILDGILLISVVAAVAEPIASGIPPTSDYLFDVVVPLVVIALFFALTILINFRWYRQLLKLDHSPPLATHDVNPPQQRGSGVNRLRLRFSLRELAGAVAAISAVLAGMALGLRDIVPQSAMHASPLEARLKLPEGASDVCISRGYRGTISYNFAIDEEGFWEWASSVGGTLESKASGTSIMPVEGSFEIYDSFAPDSVHKISRGWYYDFHVEDRAFQYAFDADERRAYFNFHAY